jgi:acyl carrier protein
METQIKQLIIDALMIEDTDADDIGTEDLLFGPDSNLGLDSVDALELAMEIERVFGVSIPESEETRKVFTSVATLMAYIQQHQGEA